MHQKLTASRIELERAKEAIAGMKTAGSFEDFENQWKDFLHFLERIWIKAERECQHLKNAFEPWQGRFTSIRRKDPLLKYLKQARDTDQHSVQEIVDKIPGSLQASLVDKRGGFIDKMTFNDKGQIEEYKGDPMIVKYTKPRCEVKSVTNNNIPFSPPEYHRGKSLKNSKDPIEIAELGIIFYEDYLNQIENKFFNNPSI